uniref:Uncharacterized protein n=1 Tax=Bactrocera dorsalis TaxID=27457 RepID=A0A034W701_BACDO
MPKPKSTKQLKDNSKETTQRKDNKKPHRKNEEDCILIEPYIEVVELIENHSKELLKATKEQSDDTKPTLPKEVNKKSTGSLKSSGKRDVKRRRSLRLLSMKADK